MVRCTLVVGDNACVSSTYWVPHSFEKYHAEARESYLVQSELLAGVIVNGVTGIGATLRNINKYAKQISSETAHLLTSFHATTRCMMEDRCLAIEMTYH
jgi:hypothetical protein